MMGCLIIFIEFTELVIYKCVMVVKKTIHCAGSHSFLLTGSIPLPLVQTYCTCLTELNSGTKKNVQVQILKGFCRDYILEGKVILAKNFEI
jgi:hypothetical protein